MQNSVGFFQFLLFSKMREPRGECLRSLYCLKHVFFLPKNIFFYLGKTFPEVFWFYFTASYTFYMIVDHGMYTCTVFLLRNQKRFGTKKFHKLVRRYLKIYGNNIMEEIWNNLTKPAIKQKEIWLYKKHFREDLLYRTPKDKDKNMYMNPNPKGM
jgi:hypothetical protein